MNSLDVGYFEPAFLPPEVKAYAGRLRQLSVGSPGKLGGLKLTLSRDTSGKTVLKDVWKQLPLQTLRPFYYDSNQPEMAIVYVLNPTGGTLQGDRLRIDATLGAGARAHITTQAATKIYRMNADYATQTINLNLYEGSYLEYLPDQTIPYRSSRYYQEVKVVMHRNSSFLYWEILTPGRMGREHFEFDIFYSKLSVEDELGNPLLSDTVVLEPKVSSSSSSTLRGASGGGHTVMGMGNYDVLGNFYLVSDSADEELVKRIHEIPHDEDTLQGVGPTSMTRGLLARVLGSSARTVRKSLETIWNEARIRVLGSPAPRIRK